MAKPLRGTIQDVQVPVDMIEFYSFDPPQMSRSVAYDDVIVRGRSEPQVFYSHTESAIWSFTIHLVASIDQEDRGDPAVVKEKANFIESLIMPDYGDSAGEFAVVKPPHLARIRILRMFDAIGTIRNPTWNYMPPYDIVTGYPHRIDVSFSFYEQRSFDQEPLGFADIRRLLSRGQTRQ